MVSSTSLQGKVCTFIYKGTFIDASPSFMHLLGCRLDTLRQMSFADIFANGAGESFLKSISAAEKTKISISQTVKLVNTIKETIDVKMEIEFDESLRIFGMCLIEPPTDKVCPSSLFDSSTMSSLKNAGGNFPAMLFIDPETKVIVEANLGATDLYGYDSNEFADMPFSNINTAPLEVTKQEIDLAFSGKKSLFIMRHRTFDGNTKDTRIRTSIVEICGKKYILCFITDITRRKYLEKVIEEKNRMLSELNVNLSKVVKKEAEERKKKEQLFLEQNKVIATGEMIEIISHYWNMPLNTISLLVQDLEDAHNFGELDTKYLNEVIRKVMKYVRMISSTVENFSEFFKPSVKQTVFDICTVIEGVTELASAKFVFNYISVFIDCECSTTCKNKKDDEECPHNNLFVKGTVNEFKQIVLSLFANSQEAITSLRESGALGIDEEGVINVRIRSNEKRITIMFEDNGGGLDISILTRAFEPYYSTKVKGTGVGLYMVKTIVEKNFKGTTSIENTQSGCRVTINLPKYIKNT